MLYIFYVCKISNVLILNQEGYKIQMMMQMQMQMEVLLGLRLRIIVLNHCTVGNILRRTVIMRRCRVCMLIMGRQRLRLRVGVTIGMLSAIICMNLHLSLQMDLSEISYEIDCYIQSITISTALRQQIEQVDNHQHYVQPIYINNLIITQNSQTGLNILFFLISSGLFFSLN